jgi:hypothetical protein
MWIGTTGHTGGMAYFHPKAPGILGSQQERQQLSCHFSPFVETPVITEALQRHEF